MPDNNECLNNSHETMTITHFEHLGSVTVRPRTNNDIMNAVPAETDRRLGNNMNPSMTTRYNAALQATMHIAVVSPPGLVDIILNSEDVRDLRVEVPIDDSGDAKDTRVVNVFQQFSEEYDAWCADRISQASEKKSGQEMTESGTESVS
ncbi:hypothetical protein [Leptothoe spongobia]|uniref:Uncharacterized protein n=1 Tax=Leptothoe spongobia TAU-MAC 1115 TaxID=1967444 RepID=A0A947DFU9_9CYAN|nr:hypothetical protein [Leptothoe spongobia]MBT9316292.1 hypothetical protein [Leptothoe spongobia TAU-MAC 1115]